MWLLHLNVGGQRDAVLVGWLLLLGDVRQIGHGVWVVLLGLLGRDRGRLLRRRLLLLLGTGQCVLELRLGQTVRNCSLSMTSLRLLLRGGRRLGQVQALAGRFIV